MSLPAELEHLFESSSPEQTGALGRALGALLQPGHFVGLSGELGAGKTHLVRAVAEGAEVPRSMVASPSFAIVYPYRGRLTLYHADLYRLADHDELYATGFFDLGLDGALLVEWIEKVPGAAPDELLWLQLTVPDPSSEERRQIRAVARGSRHLELLQQWISLAQTGPG